MPSYAHAATNHAIRANVGATSHGCCCGNHGVPTNTYVVTNLNQIIKLHAVFNHGIVQSATINTTIGGAFNPVMTMPLMK